MAEIETYACSLCSHFTSTTMSGVLRHIGSVHAYEPNFHLVCGIEGCPCTYQNYHSFRKHLRRHHAEVLGSSLSNSTQEDDTESQGLQNFYSPVEPLYLSPSPEQKIHNAALFVLKTREVLNISQTATSQILSDVTNLYRETFCEIESKVSNVLSANGIQADSIQGFKEAFLDPDPFLNLHAKHTQDKYFTEKLGLVVCYTEEHNDVFFFKCVIMIILTLG